MSLRMLTALLACILLLTACATPQATSDSVPVEPTNPPAPTVIPAETETPVLSEGEEPQEPMEGLMPFELTSPTFAQGEAIPEKYSCKGEDISPPLVWGPPPEATKSQVLIMDDPDAPIGTWVHWIVFNIPNNTYGLEEALPITGLNQVPEFISVAKNSWGRNDYGGPCPPSGTHRYFFKLYALDTILTLDKNADKKQVLSAMEGHILAQTELMGTFTK